MYIVVMFCNVVCQLRSKPYSVENMAARISEGKLEAHRVAVNNSAGELQLS